MPVYIRTHRPVFRIFVKSRFQIRHIGVNIFLHRDNRSIIRIFQQIAVCKIRRKDKVRQLIRIRHVQGDLIRPLIGLYRRPVNLHVGLLLQTLKNRPVIRL